MIQKKKFLMRENSIYFVEFSIKTHIFILAMENKWKGKQRDFNWKKTPTLIHKFLSEWISIPFQRSFAYNIASSETHEEFPLNFLHYIILAVAQEMFTKDFTAFSA